jgi:hypothetical protein
MKHNTHIHSHDEKERERVIDWDAETKQTDSCLASARTIWGMRWNESDARYSISLAYVFDENVGQDDNKFKKRQNSVT